MVGHMLSLFLLCLRRTSQEVGNTEDKGREWILGRVKSKAPNSVPLGRVKISRSPKWPEH